jgi:hypothetical protein
MLTTTCDLNYVELIHDTKNVADLLVEQELAHRMEIISPGSCNCYTSHVNSIDDFYIQLEPDQLKLDSISTIMDDAKGNFKPIDNVVINQMVAAKYPEDDCWYRSVIQEIRDDGFIVNFIDYGNSCLVKEIGEIDTRLAEIVAMSKHCTLSKPKNVISFSEEAEKKFEEITANGATILYFKTVKLRGNITEIELFCNSQNICDQLIPLCKLEGDKSNN